MSQTNNEIFVTVIVATYNPQLNKVLETINSILLQEDVKKQIIIADDCSKTNNFAQYESFLKKKGFTDYKLLSSSKNQGTIRNFARCTKECKGRYIKMISPGDYIYDSSTLRDWVEWMEKNRLLMSVADAFYYERKNDGYKLIKEHSFPQAPKVLNQSNERKKKYYQLIYNDYWLGAATLIERETFEKYINIVKDLAVYGEDNMYRIAACDGIRRGYYQKQVVMYEADTGVSSLGDKGNKWHSTLMDEWIKTNEFILKRIDVDKNFKRKFEKFVCWKRQNVDIREAKIAGKNLTKIVSRVVVLYFCIPDMIVWSVRRVLFPRRSKININSRIVCNIFDIE